MNRVVILYASVHHRNTEKVVSYISSGLQADLVNIVKNPNPDISQYELILLASGIYFQTIHKSLLEYVDRRSFVGKKMALLYTCGIPYRDYGKSIAGILTQKGARHLGNFHCRGFDTYGPLQKVGGIARNHPDQRDLDRMREQVERLLQENL